MSLRWSFKLFYMLFYKYNAPLGLKLVKSVPFGDILICRRMKLRGMRWSRDKADNVLNIRILVLNGEWDEFWKKHKAA